MFNTIGVELIIKTSSFVCTRHGAISLTMYNFGSPRVGNKKFAEDYNEVRKNYTYYPYYLPSKKKKKKICTYYLQLLLIILSYLIEFCTLARVEMKEKKA